jgi:hypothetical protein
VAVLLVSALAPAPVDAAEYEMETVATYAVDPLAGEIAVSVAVTFTNTLPDPPGQISAFSHVDLAIQEGASQVVAADDDGALDVELEAGDGAEVAVVTTRSRVRYGKSVSFTLSYLLADGAAADLHVRPGIVKFPAWGFGTSSQVTALLPSSYDARADGDPMLSSLDGATLELFSGPIPEPDRWLALITAVQPAEYVTRSASVALRSGTVDLQVRAWSDDQAWGDETLSLLVQALPMLEEAIGLPYTRVGPLVVSEAAGGEVSGEALPSATAEIQVAFDGSAFTLLHQAAHVWINDQLARDRWIREGLASHYAALVGARLGAEPPYDPTQRAMDLAADARPLVDWPLGAASGVADAYGYAASWGLVDRIATIVGEAHLAEALARIAAGLSAYDPIDPDAISSDGRLHPAVDTRRLLDQLAAVSNADVAELFREWAFGPEGAAELEQRKAARDAYRGLLTDAGHWGAPDAVRSAMSDWDFEAAQAGITDASAWLEDRDALIAECAAAGLVPPDRLRARYLADGGGAEASAELEAEQALVGAYVQVQTRAQAPRGALEAVGLFLADDPGTLLTEASASFGQGDLRAAADALDRLELALNRATSDGVVRLAGVAVLLALLGLGAGVTLRRRAGSHYTAAR